MDFPLHPRYSRLDDPRLTCLRLYTRIRIQTPSGCGSGEPCPPTYRALYVFIALAHDRRRVLHFNVTEHPTAAWTAQQIIETFPDETAPRFRLRDRDQIYGGEFRLRVARMKIEEVITAARSPWQNAYVERLIGSIRRECLDHVIVLGENHLRRILRSYFAYYHSSRTHLSLCKDAPEPRAKQPPECGPVIEIAEVGGLHHRYERRAA